ncbi:MAG: tRNA (adenosine(37)-N6)-threonylcarbamoyltransferase complex transferase subunit TsaD [Planctomycetota bacterium]
MNLILGLETSCDETAAAVVRGGVECLGQRVASQVDLHARFGGVIPEIASRSHLEALFPAIEETLGEAGVTLAQLDGLAVTVTPGLVGCLLVGLSTAKGLAISTGLPLVPVNHVHGHIYGALMPWMAERRARGEPETPPWPLASLVVSGGHTSLFESRSPTEHRRIARTIDDAAGEAYDKVAALMGLGYPGGPAIDRLARDGDPRAYDFPRSRPGGLDFSFSGLKTAVLHAVRGPNAPRGAPLLPTVHKADVAASFQAAVVDILVERLMAAAERIGAGGLVVSGGVAANSALRARAAAEAGRRGLPLFLPTHALATDNAVMIAGLGHWLLAEGRTAGLELDVLARAD